MRTILYDFNLKALALALYRIQKVPSSLVTTNCNRISFFLLCTQYLTWSRGSDTKDDRAFKDERTSFYKEAGNDLRLIEDSIDNDDYDTIVRKAPEIKDRAYAHQQAIQNITVSPSLTKAKTTFDELLTKYISFVTNMEIAAQYHISGDETASQESMDKGVEDAQAIKKAILKMMREMNLF